MPFTPILFDNNTKITPKRLRHIETQAEQAISDIGTSIREDSTRPIKSESLSSEPTGNTARIYFNSSDNKMYGYNGTEWVLLSEV